MDKTIGLIEKIGNSATYQEALERVLENPPPPGRPDNPQVIEIDSITIEPEALQSRVSMSREKVEEIKLAVELGKPIREFIVFFDSESQKIWLPDGHHRIQAYKELGFRWVSVDVRFGTKKDAIVYAAGANAEHGLQLTIEDRKKSARMLFQINEWWHCTNAAIAKKIGVSIPTVIKWRQEYSNEMKVEIPMLVVNERGQKRELEGGRKKVRSEADAIRRIRSASDGYYVACQRNGEKSREPLGRDYESAKAKSIELFHSGFFDFVGARRKNGLLSLDRPSDVVRMINSNGIEARIARGRGGDSSMKCKSRLFDFYFDRGIGKVVKHLTQENFSSILGDIILAKGSNHELRTVVICYASQACGFLVEWASDCGVEFMTPDEFVASVR